MDKTLETCVTNFCPICSRSFAATEIEKHVDKCLFLNQNQDNNCKRLFSKSGISPQNSCKRIKTRDVKSDASIASSSFHARDNNNTTTLDNNLSMNIQDDRGDTLNSSNKNSVPLSELMRPSSFDEYVGQEHILGETKLLRTMLNSNKIPSMILWGPPGCGKTSIVNVIASLCKNDKTSHLVKLSAAMAGVADIKEIVKVAKNDLKYKRKTVLFLDEIHRFNKLQQDIFLPVVENGLITLIGATTENPSFSLNSALLSRCRVMVLEKLTSDNLMLILKRAVETKFNGEVIELSKNIEEQYVTDSARLFIDKSSLQWLSDFSDGDARLALNSLDLAIQGCVCKEGIKLITLDDIKDGIKKSHLLYDRKGDEHYNTISALHKSIRASDENAALYWLTRMIESGEDPLYISRRLIRLASEDIGLADTKALSLAVSCMQGCQMIGMPECDVLLAHCTTYLARAPKSQEVYHALIKCKKTIQDQKGCQPSVPLHLRNAPTTLMKNLGYGKGYNTLHRDSSNLTYMPEELEDIDFFS